MEFKIAPEGIMLREIDQWGDLYEAMERGTPVEARITRVRRAELNGEALELEFAGRPGITGFCSVKECGLPEKTPLNDFVGQKISCKVKRIDKKNNAVVCSRKETVEASFNKLINQLKCGEIINAVVRVVNLNLYVDIGGGVILRIGQEKARLSDGVPLDLQYKKRQVIKVKVASLEKEEKIIEVELEDPWESQDYVRGEVVSGKVLLIRDNMAFVEVKHGIIGRIYTRGASYRAGDYIETQVMDYNPANRRLHLKLWDGKRTGDRRREKARRRKSRTNISQLANGNEKIRTLGGFKLDKETEQKENKEDQGQLSQESMVMESD